MDAFISAALEEVALEHRKGCSPDRLWDLLSQRGFTLPEPLKQLIWEELRGLPPHQIQFTTAGRLQAR
jgi:hypothetical protein